MNKALHSKLFARTSKFLLSKEKGSELYSKSQDPEEGKSQDWKEPHLDERESRIIQRA